MKLNSYILSLIIIVNLFSHVRNQFDFIDGPDEGYQLSDVGNMKSPDKELEIIRGYMWEIAENIDRNTNIERKKIEIGELADEYPEEMKKKAKKVRQNIKEWESVMLYPTEVWRMCIFPNFKINYVSWCKQNLALKKTKIKLNGCLNNFCLVCCDHLQLHYKEIANANEIGVKFSLNDFYGFEDIKYIVTEKEINECRSACKTHYKLDTPLILPTPPRDPTLGTTPTNPATSCIDIKRWGSESAKSGVYWLQLSTKGKHKAYCDMETDGGGWTLFYNYRHEPGQDLLIDSSKLPSSLDENSHMHLINAGFTRQDVKELRFYCKESFKKMKTYWHFKTSNPDVIEVSLTGNQQSFRSDSLSNSYTELPPDYKTNGIYKKRIFESMIENVDYYGVNTDGGFINTPFGLSKYKAYWTIRGSSISHPRYECATSHNYVGGYVSPENSPNMAKSHHTIWFRGDPPNEDNVKRRLLTMIRSDPS